MEFSRDALYEMVWTEPKTVLAKKLGLSDVGLGKICRQANIPVPPPGYWRKREVGKPTVRIPLPPRGLGKADTVEVGRPVSWNYNEPVGELPPPPTFSEPVEQVIERARKQVGKVFVSRSLSDPHHLVAQQLARDEELQKKYVEAPYPWNEPYFTAPAAKRRLRLINAIFCGLTRAGCTPTCRGKGAEELSVRVGDQWVSFSVEPMKKCKSGNGLFDATNNAARQPLRITVSSRLDAPDGIAKEWSDTDDHPLEASVPDVVLGLVVFGELHHRGNAQLRYESLVQRKAEQEERARKAKEMAEQKALEAKLRQEEARRDHLIHQAVEWNMATQLRAFIAVVQQHPEADDHRELVADWTSWALSEADRLDPMRASLQAIVEKVDHASEEVGSNTRDQAANASSDPRSVPSFTPKRPYFPGMPWFLRGR